MQFEIPFSNKKEKNDTETESENKSVTSQLDSEILDDLYKDDHIDQYRFGKKD